MEHYDSRITYFGGLDFTVLGIGNNGHIAFNEPGSSFESTTRLVDLDERTISDNSRFFNSIDEVPKQKMDNGIKNYYGLERNLLIAKGKSKWEIIREHFMERLEKVRKSILETR